MILHLQELVKQNIPDFNPENETDLIKAEKILKAHLKTDDSVSQNDIDEFLNFYKESGNRYKQLLRDKNLSDIISGKEFHFDEAAAKITRGNIDLETFGNDFETQILASLLKMLRNYEWKNLILFIQHYRIAINANNEHELKEAISEKNNLIRSVLTQYDNYQLLSKEYSFATNPDYYKLQSNFDVNYFEDEIFNINNDVADYQKTTNYHKVFLGKILVALQSFDAQDEELKMLLEKNSKIGKKWAAKENKLDQLIKKNKIDTEKDYGASVEWFLLGIFYLIIGFGLFKLYQWQPTVTYVFIVFEFFIFLFTNKKLNQHFEENSETKNDISFRRKVKKFSFKLFMLQFYAFFIGVVLAIVVALIALAFSTGVGAVIVMIFVIRFIIKAVRK